MSLYAPLVILSEAKDLGQELDVSGERAAHVPSAGQMLHFVQHDKRSG